MKKILALAITIALAVALAACGSPASEPSPAESQLEAMEARLEEMEQQVSSLQAQVPESEAIAESTPTFQPGEITFDYFLSESGLTEGQAAFVWDFIDVLGVKEEMVLFQVIYEGTPEYALSGEEKYFVNIFKNGPEMEVSSATFDVYFIDDSISTLYFHYPEVDEPYIYKDGALQVENIELE